MSLAPSIIIGKVWVEIYREIQDFYLYLRIFRFSNLQILLRKVLMINIHPELTGKQFCFEHLAFHWVQQFSVFTISKLGIVTPKTASEGSSLWSVKLYCTIQHWNWWTNISSSGRLTRCLLWFLHSICVTRKRWTYISLLSAYYV